MITLSGYKLIEVQARPIYDVARTHRKKRIAKKWRKRYGVKLVGFDNFMGDNVMIDSVHRVVYGHPHVIHRLRTFLETMTQERTVETLRRSHESIINEQILFGQDWGF